jgi:tetratricopeptide (TPR) repeat protein
MNEPLSAHDDPRLAEALDEYCAALRRGEAMSREQFLARHPEVAEGLRECLACLDLMEQAADSEGGAGTDGPGKGILGDFRLVREVGRGGMGVVYEAEQISLGRRVALKVLPFAATMDPRQLARFQNEARAAASLHHTNIVPVHAVGCERGVHYYAMQFIDGQTLAAFLDRQRTGGSASADQTTAYALSPAGPAAETAVAAATDRAPRGAAYYRRVAEWGIQAAEALDCAHSVGIVHRDVKPANLMIDGTGRLWVTDFGLARVQSDAGLTMTGDLVGTLRYMSPEQALAQRVVIDQRSDVYSLGATLYELLTLRPVFEGQDRAELLRQIAFEEPLRPRLLERAVPAELETIVLKALEKGPADRYGTAQELADDLRRFLEDRPIQARRPSLWRRSSKLARRHRSVVATAALGLVVALAVLAGSVGWVVRDREARRAETAAREAETERAAEVDLDEAERHLTGDRLPEATPALERAEGRLASGGSDRLRARLAQLRRDTTMVASLEKVRMLTSPNASIELNPVGGDRAYAAAFVEYGLSPQALPPAEVARRIRGSAIREHLVTALDEWSFIKERWRPGSGKPLQAIARLADDDPRRQRLRDLMVRQDGGALESFAAEKEALALPPSYLILLAQTLGDKGRGEANYQLLRRARQRHPRDFWVNAVLGATMLSAARKSPVAAAEAAGYLRVALAVRPQSPQIQIILGLVLQDGGKFAEAEDAYRRAIHLKPDYFEAYSNLGNALHLQKRLNEAEKAFRKAIELRPDYAWGYYNLGITLHAQKRVDEAVNAYRKAVEIQPNNAKAHCNLGNALREQKKLDEAIQACRKALEIQPNLAQASIGLGLALAEQKKFSEAEKALRRAIQLWPDSADTYNSLGAALHQQNKVDEAVRAFRKATELQPDLATAHSNLGVALRDQKRLDEAVIAYRDAIRIRPGFAEAHHSLGNALLEQKKPAEAEKAFRKAIEIKPDHAKAHLNLGVALSELKRLAEAEKAYRKAIELRPDYALAYNNLGVALRAQKRLDEAVDAFRKVIELKPDDATAHNNLGLALRAQKRPAQAEKAYRKAIEQKADYAEAYHNLGNALREQKWYAEAEKAYRKAILLKPDYAEAYSHLGLALLDQKRPAEAEKAFRRATDLLPDCAVDYINLGTALHDLKKLDEAVKAYRRAIELRPEHAVAHYNLGITLLDQKKPKEAEKAYRKAIHLQPDYAEAHCNLGAILQEQGLFAEALAAYRRGHKLGSRRPGWPYPSAQWVRQEELLVALDNKLPRCLSGEARPADAAEGIGLAKLCRQYKTLYAASARFYTGAFAAQPQLANDLSAQHRYNAACAAALAGCGQGKDAAQCDERERSLLRRRALTWLRADLARYARLADRGPAPARAAVRQQLRHWQQDANLAHVRGDALPELPEEERQAWRRLWAEVAATLAQAQDTTKDR